MAAATPAPGRTATAASAPTPGQGQETAPQSSANASGEDVRWQPVLGLPCLLTVDLPLPGFKVSDFMRLQPGTVIPTGWRVRRDVPVRVNGTLIAWAEFEGSGQNLAVRLTEVA